VDPASFSDLLRARERAYSLIDLPTGPSDLVDSFFHSVSRTALSENPATQLVGEKKMRKIAALDCNRENDAWVPRRGHVAVRSASARVWCIRRREWLAFAPSLVRRDPSRLLASRRACMGINRENDKARTSPSPHPTGVSLIHLVHFVQRMSLRRSLPASLPRLLAASSASSFAGRGRDRGRGRGGEKE